MYLKTVFIINAFSQDFVITYIQIDVYYDPDVTDNTIQWHHKQQ